jgi:hypothetical protein
MKAKLVLSLMMILAVGLLLGCGGGQKKTMKDRMLEEEDDGTSLVDSLVGDVEPEPIEEEETEQPTEVAEGPSEGAASDVPAHEGAFVGVVKVNGNPVEATFTIKTATNNPETIKEGVKSGEEVRLSPGMYDFQITTDAVISEEDFVLRDVEIPGGQRIKRDVKIPAGQITLTTGARCAKRPIRIKRKGATTWIKGKFSTCKALTLMAGEYEAEMGAGKRGTPISGIQVYDGGIRDILIRKR